MKKTTYILLIFSIFATSKTLAVSATNVSKYSQLITLTMKSTTNVGNLSIAENSQTTILSKICNVCKKLKPHSDFCKNKVSLDLLNYNCKSCNKKSIENYRKTEKGVITQIYNHQKSSSKKRGHNPPNYTKEELTTWLYNNDFKQLYDNWVKSGCQKDFKPSTDRLNDFKGYSFDNMQLGTWKENRENQYKDFKNAQGTTGRQCRKVSQFTLKGIFVKSYNSIAIASRKLGVNAGNINACCLGQRKKAGGYKWGYKV